MSLIDSCQTNYRSFCVFLLYLKKTKLSVINLKPDLNSEQNSLKLSDSSFSVDTNLIAKVHSILLIRAFPPNVCVLSPNYSLLKIFAVKTGINTLLLLIVIQFYHSIIRVALNLAIETGASQLECLPTSYAELYTQCADPEKSYSSKEWMFMRWWAINQVGRKIGKASRKCFATFRKATGNVNSRQPKQTGLDLRTIFSV